jgi:U11/U12 small nuclear ribonucleoprotein SNRNP48
LVVYCVGPDPSEQLRELVKMATTISDQEVSDEEFALSAESVMFNSSPSQRLALYDFTAQLASSKMEQKALDIAKLQSQAAKAQELVTTQLYSSEEPTGYLEQMAQRRDYRRRRQSYRARNTHITKRTSTEVREVGGHK